MVTVRDYLGQAYPAIPQRIEAIVADMFSKGMLFKQVNKTQVSNRMWELGIYFLTARQDNAVYVVVSDSLQEDQLDKHNKHIMETVRKFTTNRGAVNASVSPAGIPCNYALQTKFNYGTYVLREPVTFMYMPNGNRADAHAVQLPAGSVLNYKTKGFLLLQADVIECGGKVYYAESIQGGKRAVLSFANIR